MLVLSGGTGTPKLLVGLKEGLPPSELSVVVNTAEDTWISGNLVSPDVDTVLYTLAGKIDKSRWWGVQGDSFLTHDFLSRLAKPEVLAIGDMDRAVHIFRSDLLRKGLSLTEATASLAKALGIENAVLPMTDDWVSTMISTPEGELPFQDFWVGRWGEPDVLSIRIQGIDDALPGLRFLDLLEGEETVLIGPSNPVTSIGPILALRGVRDRLEKKNVIAVSPFVGDKPVSGPAAKFMRAVGQPASDEGVASLLGKVDVFVVDERSSYKGDCIRMNTLMKTEEDSRRLARRLLEVI